MRLMKLRYFQVLHYMSSMKKCNQTLYTSTHLLLTKPEITVNHSPILGSPHHKNQVCNYAKKVQGKGKGGKVKTIQVSEQEMSEVIDVQGYKSKLLQVQEKLKKDFAENLSLRSSASNIDNLMVKLDGNEYPLHELAQISKKNQNLIAINMAEFPEALKPTIQAIIDSGSGINPQQEGTMIYLSIPKLTREHRETLAKNAKSLFNRAKDEMKNIQNYFVKDAKQKTELPEDLVFNTAAKIMVMAEESVKEMETVLKTKQKELLGEA